MHPAGTDNLFEHQTMKKTVSELENAMILHNPGAGEGDSSKRELLRVLKSAGFKCSYSSTKQFRWENIDTASTDFLVLAGGDGTVRKVAEEILSRKLIDKKLPLGLIPMGTANNIAKTLGLCATTEEIVGGWNRGSLKKFDVGVINGLGEPRFFLESFGYGLFPRLMTEMKKRKKNGIDDTRERITAALEILLELVDSGVTRECDLEIDGKDHSGEFLLMEVMNTRSIGPNLTLAPGANPGDGQLEVVVIREEQRQQLRRYVDEKKEGKDVAFDFPLYKARKKLAVRWEGRHLHVDDEFEKKGKGVRVDIELRPGLLDFLIPAS